eukprot:1159261-Pelagomonas_calceolata.AAC.10
MVSAVAFRSFAYVVAVPVLQVQEKKDLHQEAGCSKGAWLHRSGSQEITRQAGHKGIAGHLEHAHRKCGMGMAKKYG